MPGAMRVKLEGFGELVNDLKKMDADVNAILDDALRAGASVIERLADAKAPGPHIEQSEIKRTASKVEVEIGPDKEHFYYLFFETGATAHEIRAGNAQALLFGGLEGDQYTSRVSHPGMAASPYLRPALDTGKSAAIDAVERVLRGAVLANAN